MRNRIIITLPTALLLLALASAVQAASPPPPLRSAFTAGGGTLSASGYQLMGAVGQPLAGPVGQAGGYTLSSGLIAGPVSGGNRVYLPMVRR